MLQVLDRMAREVQLATLQGVRDPHRRRASVKAMTDKEGAFELLMEVSGVFNILSFLRGDACLLGVVLGCTKPTE